METRNYAYIRMEEPKLSDLYKIIMCIVITLIFCIPIIVYAVRLTAQNRFHLKPQIENNYDLVYGHMPVKETDCVFIIGTSGTILKADAVNFGVMKQSELTTAQARVRISEENYKDICAKTKAVGILKVKSGGLDILAPCRLYKREVIEDE